MFVPPGTQFCCVDRGSVDSKHQGFLHITSPVGNEPENAGSQAQRPNHSTTRSTIDTCKLKGPFSSRSYVLDYKASSFISSRLLIFRSVEFPITTSVQVRVFGGGWAVSDSVRVQESAGTLQIPYLYLLAC